MQLREKKKISVDPTSMIKNITKFFSDRLSFIQELLQNARRAEANLVKVTLGVTSQGQFTITVVDNGHGVLDPEALITIGKSDWADKIAKEIPAGMGLFSCFKLAEKVVVRSATWCMTMTRDAVDATLLWAQPKQPGTSVEMFLSAEDVDRKTCVDIAHDFGYASRWMPFRTEVIVTNDFRKLYATANELNLSPESPAQLQDDYSTAPFTPDKWCLASQQMANGTVYVVDTSSLNKQLAHPWDVVGVPARQPITPCHVLPLQSLGNFRGARLTAAGYLSCQGVVLPIQTVSNSIVHRWLTDCCETGVTVIAVAHPGAINFSLPDRDTVLQDAACAHMVSECRRACVKLVADRADIIRQTNDSHERDVWRELLMMVAHAVDARGNASQLDIPAEIRHCPVILPEDQSRHMVFPMTNTSVTFLSRHTDQHISISEHVPQLTGKPLVIADIADGRFVETFPGVPLLCLTDMELEADPRHHAVFRLHNVVFTEYVTERAYKVPVNTDTIFFVKDAESLSNDMDTRINLSRSGRADDTIIIHTKPFDVPLQPNNVDFGMYSDDIYYDTTLPMGYHEEGVAWYGTEAYRGLVLTRPTIWSSFENYDMLLTELAPRLGASAGVIRISGSITLACERIQLRKARIVVTNLDTMITGKRVKAKKAVVYCEENNAKDRQLVFTKVKILKK